MLDLFDITFEELEITDPSKKIEYGIELSEFEKYIKEHPLSLPEDIDKKLLSIKYDSHGLHPDKTEINDDIINMKEVVSAYLDQNPDIDRHLIYGLRLFGYEAKNYIEIEDWILEFFPNLVNLHLAGMILGVNFSSLNHRFHKVEFSGDFYFHSLVIPDTILIDYLVLDGMHKNLIDVHLKTVDMDFCINVNTNFLEYNIKSPEISGSNIIDWKKPKIAQNMSQQLISFHNKVQEFRKSPYSLEFYRPC